MVHVNELMRQMTEAMESLGPSQPQLRVIVSHNLPKEHVGHDIWPIYTPAWFAFILRLFGISPFACWGARPMYRDQCLRVDDTIYVTPAVWQEMKANNAFQRQQEPSPLGGFGLPRF